MTSKAQKVVELEHVVVRFAGDSGDGMQLTGSLFSDAAAIAGNDFATFPDYPAEIRAPQGTVAGVSGFQIHFGHKEIHTSGDMADVLVAMNPAPLKKNLMWVKPGGTIIVDNDTFIDKQLEKAGYSNNPLEDESLRDYNVIQAPVSTLTKTSVEDLGLDNKMVLKSRNMFALGIMFFIFNRKLSSADEFFEQKFRANPLVVESNKRILRAGYNYAESIEALSSITYKVEPAKLQKGIYRNITGNIATAWGFLAAAEKSGRQLFLGSYPITPASEILQELSKHKSLGVKVLQAEDEIAGIVSTIGASFAGSFAITTTSGPGLSLKSEAIGLAVMTELPIVIVDVQRAGPSTGMPTKSEQSDLMQALYGRNGEAPCIVIAASSSANCFYYAFEASKLAMEHMTPVILLTDGYLANGSEVFKIPKMSDLVEIKPPLAEANDPEYFPYKRDPERLNRKWAVPGTEGLRHRIGGLEKEDIYGHVSHDPENHQIMSEYRYEKVQRVAKYVEPQKVYGPEEGELLVVSWGGTYGVMMEAVQELHKQGKSVSLAHFHYINPLPRNTEEIFSKFKRIIVPELNMGQFVLHLRMHFQKFNFEQYNKVQGLPFMVKELVDKFNQMLEGK
ncbi:MAG TPA: 2-oxoacid:acceptor oxidoreductase subunit alpha [Bacteroidales bacterium]|nr:2-oxoacid:acceptor oxidoreductase subunit alpha [Bacteroidales bacterium]HPE55153.1 2-oxoacid:acceptor oxidoreductase subunit alpha [Bacteroidales bacterium]HRX95352.1 2-oxoacid:acceptor oxidoreductase subunit alpha [Bacteroidales bacterium]